MYYLTTIKPHGETTFIQQEEVPDIEVLQAAVGGHIEGVPFFQTYGDKMAVVFCNSEGKLDGLPVNPKATYLWYASIVPNVIDDRLVGNVIIITADTEAELGEL